MNSRAEKYTLFLFAGLAILVAIAVPLYPILGGKFILLYRDIGTLILEYKMVWRESVLSFGELPLWNRWVLGGAPYLSDPAIGTYSPLNLLFLLYPARLLPQALSGYILLQLLLTIFFSYLLFRSLRVAKPWSLLLALSFGAGGGTFSYIYNPDYLGSHLFGLAFLLCLYRFCRAGELRWLFLASLSLALSAYSADPQTAYIFGVFFAPVLIAVYHQGNGWQKIRDYFYLPTLAFLAYAPQLLPALGQLAGTVRDPRMGPMPDFQSWSFHPLRLLEWVAALPFGTDIYEKSALLPYLNGPDPAPFIASTYAGIIFLPLLLALFPAVKKNRPLRAWLMLGVLFLLLSFGSFSFIPFNAGLAKILPLWNSFRYPERMMIFSQLSFTLAIAAGLAEEDEKIWSRVFFLLPFSLLGGSLLIFWGNPAGKSGAIFSVLLGSSLLLTLAMARRRPALAPLWTGAILLFSSFDLCLATARLVFPVPSVVARPEFSPFSRYLRQQTETLPVRFFMANETQMNWEKSGRFGYGLENQAKASVLQSLALRLNLPGYFHQSSPLGFATVMNPRHQQLWDQLGMPLTLALKGTKYLGLEKDGAFSISVLREYLPYLSVPDEVWYSPADPVTLRLLRSPGWVKRLLVQSGTETLPSFAPQTQKTRAEFTIERHSYSGLSVQISLPESRTQATWLQWNETYSRNWNARLDGKEIPIHIGNYWATAIALPPLAAGNHQLQLQYEDPLIPLGRVGFGFWLLLLGIAETKRRRKL